MSPEAIIDQLNCIDWKRLFDPSLDTDSREALWRVAKKQYAEITRDLKAEQAAIAKQWDSRNSHEASAERHNLAPYEVLADSIRPLDILLEQVHAAITSKTALPAIPQIPQVIFGDSDTGEWHVGTLVDRLNWEYQRAREKLVMEQHRTMETARQRMLDERYQIADVVDRSKTLVAMEQKTLDEHLRDRNLLGERKWLFILLSIFGIVSLFEGLRLLPQIPLSGEGLFLVMFLLIVGVPGIVIGPLYLLIAFAIFIHAVMTTPSARMNLQTAQDNYDLLVREKKTEYVALIHRQKNAYQNLVAYLRNQQAELVNQYQTELSALQNNPSADKANS